MRQALWILWVILLAAAAQAQPLSPLALDTATEWADANPYTLLLEDPTRQLSAHEILSALPAAGEQPPSSLSPRTPLEAPHAYWAVLHLRHTFPYPKQWVLETGGLDLAEFYLFQDHSQLDYQKTGRMVPASQRAVLLGDNFQNKFIFELDGQQTYTVLVRLYNKSKLPVEANLQLYELEHWERITLRKELTKQTIFGFMVGFFTIMMLYNFLLFVFSGDKVYLYYAAYIFFPMMYIVNANGIFLYTPLGEFPEGFLYTRGLAPCISLIFYLLFMRHFLDTPTLLGPRKDRLIDYLIVGEGINAIITVVGVAAELPEKTYRMATVVVHAIALISILVFLVMLFRTGQRLARYFVVGASFFILSAVFLAVVVLGKSIPYEVGVLGQAMGIAFELITFSLGLGYRIRMIERDRARVQEENAKILEMQNQVLESRVKERTAEIEKQKEEIMTQNEELYQQQEEIVAQRDYIEQQKSALEEQNSRMTDSIRYAQTIQQAILPLEGRLDQIFEGYFVLYRPKDIVSGDFYWLMQAENKVYLAVVDCTGHGVPGAFMSLVGSTVLDDIITKERIFSPAEILEHLNTSIQFLLKQYDEGSNQDGMDVCLCRFENISLSPDEPKRIQVTFAGAKRPLYYYDHTRGELCQLKGDRKSIGGIQRGDKAFADQTVVLEKGSVLYLTTDGYVDQHNLQGRKIGSLRLEEAFEEVKRLPMKEQGEAFARLLDEHQGEQLQRDDITFVAVEL